MMIHDILESIKLFIILNPWETVLFMFVVFTFFGMYMEDVFKIWNWGPKCNRCKEWHIYSDSVILCTKCDAHRCNDEWQAGVDTL